MFVSPKLVGKSDGTWGLSIKRHLSEHKWNVLSMHHQPTMQAEKNLQWITSIKLLKCPKNDYSISAAATVMPSKPWKLCSSPSRGWNLTKKFPMVIFSERVTVQGCGKMFHLFNSAFRVVFVMMLQTALIALVTYQTNLKQEQNRDGQTAGRW